MKGLYCYFGLIRPHDIDSPGHFLYQLGLLDSIKDSFSIDNFDFYSYYPNSVIELASIECFPDCEHGKIFTKYYDKLISTEVHQFSDTLENIKNVKYERLFLKARFRNLSTLHKKWKDALEFEVIIETAVAAGYQANQIIILDTDLSLPDSFYLKYGGKVTVIVPSIDIPGISSNFLFECCDINKGAISNQINSVFYGNIDTSNYKIGNSKNSILLSAIETMINESNHSTIISKPSDFNSCDFQTSVQHIDRRDRVEIFKLLASSNVMLNVTKEKYSACQFIPARVFEALIFGMIPVSYNFEFLCPAFSFNSIDDLTEIYKYLQDCDSTGLGQAYEYFIKSYADYVLSIPQLVIEPVAN